MNQEISTATFNAQLKITKEARRLLQAILGKVFSLQT
jgi:hypothetical protein